MTSKILLRWLNISLLVLLIVVIAAAVMLDRKWQQRPELDSLPWPTANTEMHADVGVHVTWLGITTLLFDDGETQILIDGNVTRVGPLSLLLSLPIKSDIAAINHALTTFSIDRLAAIIPVHSHFDHAMDVGHIANRTSALVLGSESTANIARGANVPVDQYQILANEESRQFGEFTVRLVASEHAPIAFSGGEFFPGAITEPLRQPAAASAWKTGVAWSVFVEHPRGTTLIQGSGGIVAQQLQDERPDVVMLGVGGLAKLGQEYLQRYWHESVEATGAKRVVIVHHDDLTAPFGEIRLLPTFIDDVPQTAQWIDSANKGDVVVELPPFGMPIPLY